MCLVSVSVVQCSAVRRVSSLCPCSAGVLMRSVCPGQEGGGDLSQRSVNPRERDVHL